MKQVTNTDTNSIDYMLIRLVRSERVDKDYENCIKVDLPKVCKANKLDYEETAKKVMLARETPKDHDFKEAKWFFDKWKEIEKQEDCCTWDENDPVFIIGYVGEENTLCFQPRYAKAWYVSDAEGTVIGKTQYTLELLDKWLEKNREKALGK